MTASNYSCGDPGPSTTTQKEREEEKSREREGKRKRKKEGGRIGIGTRAGEREGLPAWGKGSHTVENHVSKTYPLKLHVCLFKMN